MLPRLADVLRAVFLPPSRFAHSVCRVTRSCRVIVAAPPSSAGTLAAMLPLRYGEIDAARLLLYALF